MPLSRQLPVLTWHGAWLDIYGSEVYVWLPTIIHFPVPPPPLELACPGPYFALLFGICMSVDRGVRDTQYLELKMETLGTFLFIYPSTPELPLLKVLFRREWASGIVVGSIPWCCRLVPPFFCVVYWPTAVMIRRSADVLSLCSLHIPCTTFAHLFMNSDPCSRWVQRHAIIIKPTV